MYGLTHSDEKRFRDGEMAETMREVERDTHTHNGPLYIFLYSSYSIKRYKINRIHLLM